MDLVREAGGTCIQLSLGWDRIEPQPGGYRWDETDARVRDAEARGLDLYACINDTPAWAVPEPEPGHDALPGYRTPPDECHADSFAAFCREAARRYRGRIRHFTFWNEPNGCGWINAGCSNSSGYPLYTRWLRRATRALKAGNPDCVVAAGALDYHSGVPDGWRYLQGIYDEGGKGAFDAVEIHPYAPSGIHWQAIRDTRRVMLENGDGEKPIWIGEYGWPDAGSERASRDLEEFLDLIRREEFDFISHARYLVVSDLNEGLYGLSDAELHPRPIYDAFKRAPKAMLPRGSAPPIPELAQSSAMAAPGEERPESESRASLQLHCPKSRVEYGEEVVIVLTPPRARGSWRAVRWYVDGLPQEGAGSLRYCFARRPETETVYTIRAVMQLPAGSCEAACAVTVRPFVSNRFTVMLDDPPRSVEASQPLLLGCRVLNRSSHDLTFSWKVDGEPWGGANGGVMLVESGILDPGWHEVEVTCINAGERSSDSARIEFRSESARKAEGHRRTKEN